MLEVIVLDTIKAIILGVLAVVVVYLSKIAYEIKSNYFARKFIHFACGIVTIFIPYIFKTPVPLALMFFGLFYWLYLHHKKMRLMKWFQIEKLYGEVYFCFAYFALFLIYWYYDINIAIASVLFMAFGDGITGIVKEHFYGKREFEKLVKGLNLGNLAMLLICLPIGYYYCGIAGILGAIFASWIESFEKIDDNVTIPFGSAAVITLFKSFGL
jgi:dolichol kinase